MRLSVLFVGISLSLAVQASWFGGGSSSSSASTTASAALPYTTWSVSELREWLDAHSITLPASSAQTEAELRALVADNWGAASSWTYEQYAAARKAFAGLGAASFDKWDDSRLREFLLRQGVVAPKGPRERLVRLAKDKYREYMSAASEFGARAGATASGVVFGEEKTGPAESLSSVAAQATRAFDEGRDYVYAAWDENRMRKYLEDKGVLKAKEEKKRAELVQMMHDAYGRVVNPIWEAWSDSYLHHWLESHNIIIKSQPKKDRDYYVALMKRYYYTATDNVWHNWTDSQLRQWLVDRNVVKSNAQVSREKMIKMVQDNYLSAKDTFWSAWTDNQLKDWLVANGYMRSDAQVKRDELIKLAEAKYKDINAKTAAYLTWPDARLRAYLREHGVSEEMVPGARPGLLQEVRIRWVQTETKAESVLSKIREVATGGAHGVEDVLSRVVYFLSNGWVDLKRSGVEKYEEAEEQYENVKGKASEGYEEVKRKGQKGYDEAKRKGEAGYEGAKEKVERAEGRAEERWEKGRDWAGEKIKEGGEKVKANGEL